MKEFHGSVKILMIERHENGFNRFVNSRNALQLILIDSFSFFLFFFRGNVCDSFFNPENTSVRFSSDLPVIFSPSYSKCCVKMLNFNLKSCRKIREYRREQIRMSNH